METYRNFEQQISLRTATYLAILFILAGCAMKANSSQSNHIPNIHAGAPDEGRAAHTLESLRSSGDPNIFFEALAQMPAPNGIQRLDPLLAESGVPVEFSPPARMLQEFAQCVIDRGLGAETDYEVVIARETIQIDCEIAEFEIVGEHESDDSSIDINFATNHMRGLEIRLIEDVFSEFLAKLEKEIKIHAALLAWTSSSIEHATNVAQLMDSNGIVALETDENGDISQPITLDTSETADRLDCAALIIWAEQLKRDGQLADTDLMRAYVVQIDRSQLPPNFSDNEWPQICDYFSRYFRKQ